MTKIEEGFYCDWEGIRHRCLGMQKQYTFEEVTSIFECGIHTTRLLSWAIEVIVVEATNSFGLKIPCPVDAIVDALVVESEKIKEIESQSSIVILEPSKAQK